MAEKNNNNNAIAAGVGSGIGAGITSAMSNLWSAKERRQNQRWQERQYWADVDVNRQNSNLEWERQTDYKYQMEQYKKANINPYAILGQSFNAPSTASSHGQSSPTARYDFSGAAQAVGAIPQQIMQLKLMQAEQKNKEANTNLINAETTGKDISNQFAPLQNAVGLEQANATIGNLQETQKNLVSSRNQIEQLTLNEKTKNEGQQILNSINAIQQKYEERKQQLSNELLTYNNQKSQAEIINLRASLNNINATTQKINSEIETNLQSVLNGKMSIRVMAMQIEKYISETMNLDQRTITEKEMRPYRKWESGSNTIRNGTQAADNILEFVIPKKKAMQSFQEEGYNAKGEYWEKKRSYRK